MWVELLIRYAKYCVALVIVWVLLFLYGSYGCAKIQGNEMVPMIGQEDFKMTSTVSSPADVRFLDVVVFEFEADKPQKQIAGRVLGVAGDRIRVVEGKVFVNGQEAPFNFVAPDNQSVDSMPEIIVPRDSFFIVCDNRRTYQDRDSRAIGPVHFDAIIGKLN